MQSSGSAARIHHIARVIWAGASIVLAESAIFALSMVPAVMTWAWLFDQDLTPHWLDVMILAVTFVPAYLVFAVSFAVLSAVVTGLFGWRSPENRELAMAEMEWPLLNWARYNISIYVAGVLAGPFLRTTPVWNFYMRLNGARIGRRVWINSLKLSDHNLLHFGDDVVIGSDAHLSGHIVERGRVLTARVKLDRGVVVGLGSHVGIGVQAGPECQIGSLSMVPKFSVLEERGTYVGTPVRRVSRAVIHPDRATTPPAEVAGGERRS